jgi:hypothetical protein
MKRKASAGSFGGLLAKCEAGGRVAGFALKTPFATAARAGPGAGELDILRWSGTGRAATRDEQARDLDLFDRLAGG